MLDIKSAIYSLLADDATDKRIHSWYLEENVSGEIELSDSKGIYGKNVIYLVKGVKK